MENKTSQIELIAEELRELKQSPLFEYRKENKYSVVIGEGDPDASILFIGEAPGKQEAITGRPFVGASGKFLDNLLHGIGLDRKDVYITNIVKDRPPENRDPTPAEIRLYVPFLQRQIEIIQPKVIATLGRFAMDFILDQFNIPEKGQKITALHGQVLHAKASYGLVAVIPLFHPAVALYNQNQRETLEKDFAGLKKFI